METLETTGARHSDLTILIGRICIAVLFIVSGFGKILRGPAFASAMAAKGVPFPEAFPYLAILIELVGGIVLILGFKTRLLALLYVVYIMFATWLVHDFWTMAEPQRAANLLHFDKNLSIVGGFILLFVTGGGVYSLDRLMSKRFRRKAAIA